jgi:hypothetical protein
MFEDLTDDELQRIEDIQFEDELSSFVAELQPPSLTMERDYQAKMDLLQQIHSEVFPPPTVEEEYTDQDMYDTRYHTEYEYNPHPLSIRSSYPGKIQYRSVFSLANNLTF